MYAWSGPWLEKVSEWKEMASAWRENQSEWKRGHVETGEKGKYQVDSGSEAKTEGYFLFFNKRGRVKGVFQRSFYTLSSQMMQKSQS